MDSCLSDDRAAPLTFEKASFQSYLKQLPWSSRPSHGAHRLSRPVGSGIYACAESNDQVAPLLRAHSGLENRLLPSYLLDEFREDCLLSPGGLVRSQSYPLEGFYSALENCIANITKTSSIIESKVCTKNRKSTSSSEDSCSKPQQQAQKDSSTKPQQQAQKDSSTPPIISELSQRKQDEKVSEPSKIADKTTLPVSPNIADATMDMAAKGSHVGRGLASNPPSSTSPKKASADTLLLTEDDLSNRASLSSQARHCAAARQCPLGCKVLACGRRKEMEDTASVVPSFAELPCGVMGMCCCNRDHAKQTASDLHFFGVYDGHGGSQASTYCKERLHVLLAEELRTMDKSPSICEHPEHGWDARWNDTFKGCFSKVDKEVGGVCPRGICDDETIERGCACCEDAIAPENVGTTAVVAVVGSCQIVIANCGDSRAVLSRGGKAMALSTDHKPERDDETLRIEAAGGKVICWDGYRVGGFLALSRAIGDRYLKRYVISEPEVTCIPRKDDDELLILASDGLWDVLSNDYACEVARKALVAARKKRENRSFAPGEDPAAASVAALLVKLAYSKGSKDNISVVMVDLKS